MIFKLLMNIINIQVMKVSEDWEKFLMCNIKPDSINESELTTFITMYKESNQVQNLKIKEEMGI